jgi:hypothetical protein
LKIRRVDVNEYARTARIEVHQRRKVFIQGSMKYTSEALVPAILVVIERQEREHIRSLVNDLQIVLHIVAIDGGNDTLRVRYLLRIHLLAVRSVRPVVLPAGSHVAKFFIFRWRTNGYDLTALHAEKQPIDYFEQCARLAPWTRARSVVDGATNLVVHGS